MTAKMAEELTHISSARGILSTLNRNNYFTEKHFQDEPIYQFHPLFREFLLSRAKSTFSNQSSSALCSAQPQFLKKLGRQRVPFRSCVRLVIGMEWLV